LAIPVTWWTGTEVGATGVLEMVDAIGAGEEVIRVILVRLMPVMVLPGQGKVPPGLEL
jgi:hypothetical protein